MKISNLIHAITYKANCLFGQSWHINDAIYVSIYVDSNFEFQVWLERPSQKQLDYGEVEPPTQKIQESKVGFYTTGKTLLGALIKLRDKISNASEEEFSL